MKYENISLKISLINLIMASFTVRTEDKYYHKTKIGYIRGCIHKFPDWPPGAITANGTALCHYVQLYRYPV